MDLSKYYGFGFLNSVGELFTLLVMPGIFIAIVAVIFYFLIGAIRFVASGGDKDAVAGARKMMVHSLVGLFLLVFAFVLLTFVLQVLGVKIKLF